MYLWCTDPSQLQKVTENFRKTLFIPTWAYTLLRTVRYWILVKTYSSPRELSSPINTFLLSNHAQLVCNFYFFFLLEHLKKEKTNRKRYGDWEKWKIRPTSPLPMPEVLAVWKFSVNADVRITYLSHSVLYIFLHLSIEMAELLSQEDKFLLQ